MSTILASTRDRELLAASAVELDQAKQVVDHLSTNTSLQLSMNRSRGDDLVEIPRELSAIIAQVLTVIARGGTVTVGSMPDELTTSTAAEQLGVSRPTLMKMIDRGEIEARKVGSHTRLRSADVMLFRKDRLARRRAAFEALRAMEDELD
ncbi:helix-turn-helix domain-containing protein [Nakamurella antarctica]|uniref:Helix-turn-helix domain-containing protein n=1 Tax=Nakamurella antarctica TaxID=1902245 RepID=A0A3G8ZNK2_9ACTN|nr:excisionase family DNA-binding protein [Nakamurella antarctica]AZI58879.1 helix-turn-helix domain-containing protein [Nakamurella antarctica]